jgi:hypothetical protein
VLGSINVLEFERRDYVCIKVPCVKQFRFSTVGAFYRAIRAAMKSLVKSGMNANISLMN